MVAGGRFRKSAQTESEHRMHHLCAETLRVSSGQLARSIKSGPEILGFGSRYHLLGQRIVYGRIDKFFRRRKFIDQTIDRRVLGSERVTGNESCEAQQQREE